MKRLFLFFLLGVSTLFVSSPTHALRVEPSIILASSPNKVYYGSTLFYYYDNHLIVPAHGRYDKRAMRDMARLSRHLGWRNVYLLSPNHQYGIPNSSRHYAHRYFSTYGISYNYYYPRYSYSNRIHKPYRYYDRGYRHYDRRHNQSGFYFSFSF